MHDSKLDLVPPAPIHPNGKRPMVGKLSGRFLSWFIGIALLSSFIGYWFWHDSQSLVVLLPHGRAAFYRGGFFHRDKFELTSERGNWYFFRSEPFERGELLLPFECPYNEYKLLRLEVSGKVYMVDKKKMTREELRVVHGEWSYDASDHWQSIFDLDVPVDVPE